MAKKNNQVVIAIFDDQNSAETALEDLNDWINNSKNLHLGAAGTLGRNENKLAINLPRQIVKGVFLGTVVGLIAGVFISSLSIIIAAAIGALVGGLLGAYFKKSTTMNLDQRIQVFDELDDGKVAVMATVSDYHLQNITEKMESLGGKLISLDSPVDGLVDVA